MLVRPPFLFPLPMLLLSLFKCFLFLLAELLVLEVAQHFGDEGRGLQLVEVGRLPTNTAPLTSLEGFLEA